jgi:hypothetical protein
VTDETNVFKVVQAAARAIKDKRSDIEFEIKSITDAEPSGEYDGDWFEFVTDFDYHIVGCENPEEDKAI